MASGLSPGLPAKKQKGGKTLKYTITISQFGIVQSGLHEKTDLVDWALIDYLTHWYFAERKKTIFVQEKGINFVWINYNHLIDEMPLIGIKSKNAVSKRIQKLKKLGLIETFSAPDKSLYFILTQKCIDIIGFSGNNKRLSPTAGQGVPRSCTGGVPRSCTAQTYNNIKHSTNISTLSDSKNPTNNALEIFNHWNSKEIVKHKKLTDKIKRAINGALADYNVDEITTAIDNYDKILRDSKYYFKYRWTLKDFLQRGLEKFIDWNICSENYKKDKNTGKEVDDPAYDPSNRAYIPFDLQDGD